MNITISAEEVRGGKGAALLGRYFHSTGMTLTLTNATFNMAYLAAVVGADLSNKADIMKEETLTLSSGKLTLSQTPVPLAGCNNTAYAWYKAAGAEEYTRAALAADSKEITITGGTDGDTYCVKYFYEEAAATELTVKSDFVPKTLHLVLDANLYAVGDTAISGQTNVGTIYIDVPAFQLNGTQDFTMNMSGAATINLEGTALAVSTCDANCKDGKYYAKISQIIAGDNWYDDTKMIAVDKSSEIKAGDTLSIYAIDGKTAPSLITKDMLSTVAGTGANIYAGDTDISATLKVPAGASAGSLKIALKVDGVEKAATYINVSDSE